MTQRALNVLEGSLEPVPGRTAPVMLSAPNAINGHKIIHSFWRPVPGFASVGQ